MKRRTSRIGMTLAAVAGVAAVSASAASAASTPSFSRCPTATPGVFACLDVNTTGGSIGANRNSINVGGAIAIQGGIRYDDAVGDNVFVPPVSGDALTGRPVTVASNIFGTGLPFTLNSVTATVQQVGPITFNYSSFDITAPIRVRFDNALLGSSCTIGSAASPITLHLTTGITNPPAPNTPIAGNGGTFADVPGADLAVQDVLEVDNAYAVPAATSCGAASRAAVTKIINKQLGLPSPAGTNTAQLTNDIYFKFQ
jgi:hypothetical protein